MQPKSGKAETRRQVLWVQAAQSVWQTGKALSWEIGVADTTGLIPSTCVPPSGDETRGATCKCWRFENLSTCGILCPSTPIRDAHTASSGGPHSPLRLLFYRQPQQYADNLVEEGVKLSSGPGAVGRVLGARRAFTIARLPAGKSGRQGAWCCRCNLGTPMWSSGPE